MITNILLIVIALYLLIRDDLDIKLHEKKEKEKETLNDIILEYNNVLNNIKETQNKAKEYKIKEAYNEMYLLAMCTPATARYLERLGYDEKVDYCSRYKAYPPATVVTYKRHDGARYEYGQGYSYLEVIFNHNKFMSGTVIGTEDNNNNPIEIVVACMPTAEGNNFRYMCRLVTQDENAAIPKECLKVGTIWEFRFVSYNQ